MDYNITSEDKILVNVEYLAQFFDRDKRTVQLWASEDGMPKEEHGTYDLIACARWKYQSLQDEIEVVKASFDEKLHALKMETQRLINEEKKLKFRKLLGELVDYDDVRMAWVGETKLFRKALNSMVPKLVDSLEGINDKGKRRQIIQDRVKEVLTHISENLKIESDDETVEDFTDAADELDNNDLFQDGDTSL